MARRCGSRSRAPATRRRWSRTRSRRRRPSRRTRTCRMRQRKGSSSTVTIRTWKPKLNVTLPDYDVVEIDVATRAVRRNYAGVGTILFNLAQRPKTNELWVANTEARNLVRFEPGSPRPRHRQPGHPHRDGQFSDGDHPRRPQPGTRLHEAPECCRRLATALSQPTDIAFDPTGANRVRRRVRHGPRRRD